MEFDDELLQRIQHHVEAGHWEAGSKEHGVALQVAHQGIGSLSPKQRTVWEKGVEPILQMPLNGEEEFQQALREDQRFESEQRR